MEQMLTYPQISMQLKRHVELYNQQHPQDNSLRDITDNTIIYNTIGCYVRILQVLVGNRTGEQYKEFDWLCQCYQEKAEEERRIPLGKHGRIPWQRIPVHNLLYGCIGIHDYEQRYPLD